MVTGFGRGLLNPPAVKAQLQIAKSLNVGVFLAIETVGLAPLLGDFPGKLTPALQAECVLVFALKEETRDRRRAPGTHCRVSKVCHKCEGGDYNKKNKRKIKDVVDECWSKKICNKL